jgi:hypothetical protein
MEGLEWLIMMATHTPARRVPPAIWWKARRIMGFRARMLHIAGDDPGQTSPGGRWVRVSTEGREGEGDTSC